MAFSHGMRKKNPPQAINSKCVLSVESELEISSEIIWSKVPASAEIPNKTSWTDGYPVCLNLPATRK